MQAGWQHQRPGRAGSAVFAGWLLSAFTMGAGAQSVSLSGSMGDKALLIINGTPRAVAVGSTVQGVKVISVNAASGVVEIDGQRATLPIGGAPTNLGGKASEGGSAQIVLTAGPGGHFVTSGSINGKSVQFMVDTGATMIALGQREADRIGLKYKDGARGMVNTANGQVPVHRTSLGVVRVGDVQVYNVEAVVMPMETGTILLGNSFLTRFQMKRENDKMTLDRRP